MLVPIEEIPEARSLGGGGRARESDALQTVAHWAREYLCNPHPDLGRAGDVCPWCRPSIDLRLFWLCTIRGASDAGTWCDPPVLELIDAFHACAPGEGDSTQFKTILAIFPDLRDCGEIATVHARLKPSFLDSGLMLGEFFADCDKPGVRNRAFRPLRAPLPLLVVREMLEVDIVFLADRPEFVTAYLRKHRDRGRQAISRLLKHAAGVGFSDGEISNLKRSLG